jgi:hypothetical protein
VVIEQLGSRNVACNATMLWGVELSTDSGLPHEMLIDLVRAAHANELSEGVTFSHGHCAFLRCSRSRWHLSTACGEQLTLDLADTAHS